MEKNKIKKNQVKKIIKKPKEGSLILSQSSGYADKNQSVEPAIKIPEKRNILKKPSLKLILVLDSNLRERSIGTKKKKERKLKD